VTPSQKHIKKALHALGVITLDPRIRVWLLNNDPQAFRQCEEARTDLELELEPYEKERA